VKRCITNADIAPAAMLRYEFPISNPMKNPIIALINTPINNKSGPLRLLSILIIPHL
jgi:hypothetical protein